MFYINGNQINDGDTLYLNGERVESNVYVNGELVYSPSIPSFADMSWNKINEISLSGRASQVFSVGDKKVITLSTGAQVTLVILGFDHDDKAGGGKAGISIGMENCLATRYPMNTSDTNAGGWNASAMRTETMQTLFSQLPADLQGVIKLVFKKSMSGGGAATVTTTSIDQLFLLAAVEICGDTINLIASELIHEGEQYEYWRTIKDGSGSGTNPNRVKTLGDNGRAIIYWLRSCVNSQRTRFGFVSAGGGFSINGSASQSNGVTFCFCV